MEVRKMDELFEKMKGVISKSLEIPADKITMDSVFLNLAADSLYLYELVYALEEKMGITIPDEQANEFKTVWDAYQYIVQTQAPKEDISKNPPDAPLNDTSLSTSDRRTVAVIADNAAPMIGGIAHYTMTQAKKLFKFPPNHPVPGSAYAMIDVYPDHYVPLSSFHEHYKQTKHAAFIELCASLGAKEICIESAEINSRTLDINGDIKTPLSGLGLGISVKENRETGQKIAFKFSEANKEIKDFDSPWLYTEPSWLSMNNLRRKNHLQELGAEFTCLDEMGINVNLAAKMKGVGINIGGNFQEMTKIRLSYSVVFW
jgi:acyl carrier protein